MRQLRLLVLVTAALWVVLLTARADIFDTISGWFNTITSIPGDVVRKIYGAVKGVFDFFSHVGQILDGAWDWMVNGFEWLGDRAAWLAGATFNTARWLLATWIPDAVNWAVGTVGRYALGLVDDLRKWVTARFDDVVRFFRGLIHDVEQWARRTFERIWEEIRKAADWIAKATTLVFGILAHPGRLVDWIIGSLVVPLIKWLIESAAPVIAWLARSIIQLAPTILNTIEHAIADIL